MSRTITGGLARSFQHEARWSGLVCARTRKRSSRTYMCRPPCDLCTSATNAGRRPTKPTAQAPANPRVRFRLRLQIAPWCESPHLRCITGGCTHSFNLPERSRRWLVHTLCLPEGINHRACRVWPYRPGRQVAPAKYSAWLRWASTPMAPRRIGAMDLRDHRGLPAPYRVVSL